MKHTMSYTSGSSDTPLLGITIGDMFDQTVARYPDNEALVVRHQSIRYTYRQLNAQVDRCARALLALGVALGVVDATGATPPASFCPRKKRPTSTITASRPAACPLPAPPHPTSRSCGTPQSRASARASTPSRSTRIHSSRPCTASRMPRRQGLPANGPNPPG